MDIQGKVYCFFEQSGVFKNEFKKLGYHAECYDIQNNFGETDHVMDLFAEIEKGYDGKPSIFDPMMGSQSSRIAAYKLGYDYWGCELEKLYYDKGNERFDAICNGVITTSDGQQVKQLSLFDL